MFVNKKECFERDCDDGKVYYVVDGTVRVWFGVDPVKVSYNCPMSN